MKTVVVNLANHAVSESDNGVRINLAGTDCVLNSDKIGAISHESARTGLVLTGLREWGDGRKKIPESVYVHMTNVSAATIEVVTVEGDLFEYNSEVWQGGVTRAMLGKGVRENYLSFTFTIDGTGSAAVDAIDVRTVATMRTR